MTSRLDRACYHDCKFKFIAQFHCFLKSDHNSYIFPDIRATLALERMVLHLGRRFPSLTFSFSSKRYIIICIWTHPYNVFTRYIVEELGQESSANK